MSEITALIKTLQKDNKDRAKLDAQRTEDIRAMREAQSGDVVNKGAEIEATKEATANNKKTTNLLKTMSGSLTGILSATKNLASKAKTGFFTALKGLAFGAFLLAVGKFLDSPTFKSLTKKIGEITQKFADIYKVFEEEGFIAGIDALKENIGLVGGAILGLAALFAPGLLFKGLMFGGKLIYKGGFLVLRTLFRLALGKALFGAAGDKAGGGVFTRLMSGIKSMGQGMKNMVSKSIKSGLLAGSKVVGSIRGAFAGFFAAGGPLSRLGGRLGFMLRTMGGLVSASVKGGLLAGSNILTSIRGAFGSFFAKGGPLSRLGSRIGFMARTMGGLVSRAIKSGLLAGSNILTSLRGRFAGFFATGGPLSRLGSNIGTTVTNMGKRIGSAVSKGVFSSGLRGIGGKFGLLFGVLGTFSEKLGSLYNAAVPAIKTALQRAVSLLPASVQKLLPKAFQTVAAAPTRITSSMRTALSSMKGAGQYLKSASVVPRVVKGIVDMAPEGSSSSLAKRLAASKGFIQNTATRLSPAARAAFGGYGQFATKPIVAAGKATKALSQNSLKALGKLGKLMPLVGPLISGFLITQILENPDLSDEDKAKQVGGLLGSQLGITGFMALGGLLGTLGFPGFGTVLGAVGMGTLGFFGGDYLGQKVGAWMMGTGGDLSKMDVQRAEQFLRKRSALKNMSAKEIGAARILDTTGQTGAALQQMEIGNFYAAQVNSNAMTLPEAQKAFNDFSALNDMPPMVITMDNHSKTSNTTVSSSNLGVADQMFSYGGVQ